MENNINVLFGRKVAKLRKLQGISQEELAERCGIHRTYIGAIERGEKSPTLNTIEKIANGLNVEIIELWEVKQID
ncbi:MAG: helix-turn-helix transcriptional regulator [Bacteroidales bacterium]|nr:helix-turn-helix transcriptional regulator [Bacteroidales bacterium]